VALVTVVVSWRRGAPLGVVMWRVLVIAYLTALVALTFFPFQVKIDEFTGSSTWWNSINWEPIVTIDPIGFAENVLLTAPLGFLVPALTRRRTLRAVLLVGLVVSVSIEVLQYADVRLLSGGRLADVNDVIANVLGVAIGYAVYRVFRSSEPLARLLPNSEHVVTVR
jgi:glycopeptide antibiotics resistance protein